MRTLRLFVAVLTAVLTALAISAPTLAQQPIKIGIGIAQTGALCSGGKPALAGAADVARRRER